MDSSPTDEEEEIAALCVSDCWQHDEVPLDQELQKDEVVHFKEEDSFLLADISSSEDVASLWLHLDRQLSLPGQEDVASLRLHLDRQLSPPGHHNQQRACRDLDTPLTHSVLTPFFQISRDVSFLLHFGERALSQNRTSPAKRLEAHPLSAEVVAGCTYRLESNDGHILQYATAFAASPTALWTARHAIFPSSTSDYYTVINSLPAADTMFQNVQNTKGCLRKAPFLSMTKVPQMLDPMRKTAYSTFGEYMDATALFLNNRAKYRGQILKRMQNFLLPMSLLDAIELYGKEGTIAIGVCGFPMFSEFLKKLRSVENADREYIFQTYKSSFSSYWHQLRQEKKTEHEKKMCFYQKIVEVLEYTFQEFCTGAMACSVGRVVGYDDTAIASSYSCLSGSSGSPLFSPDIPFAGVFLGIHNGPAEKKIVQTGEIYPDYNIATSSDNLGFVAHHFQNVVPTLPPPSSFKDADTRRLKAHCSWMWRHINFILASKEEITGGTDWTNEHASWLGFMLQEMEVARTLSVELTDAEETKLVRKCKEIVGELFLVYKDCTNVKRVNSLEEFAAMFNTAEDIFLLLQRIAPRVRNMGVAVHAWGFPRKCAVHSVHVLQKLALALE